MEKVVIFPCGRSEAHRRHVGCEKRGSDRSGKPFIIYYSDVVMKGYGGIILKKALVYSMEGVGLFDGDSEVPVGKHDEGYCAQQWNRGDVGMHNGRLYIANMG